MPVRGHVKYAYNAQRELTWVEDQATNVLERVYDAGGRMIDLKISTVASGFDGSVRRISCTYDNLWRPALLTQFDALTSGNVLDEVKYSYNDWGPVSTFQQDPDSAVATSGGNDFNVSYSFAKATAGRQIVRRATQSLPSGLQINYVYSSSGGLHDDEACRVTSMNNNGTVTFAKYDYDGIGQVIGITFPEPQASSKLFGSSAGSYPALDTLDRITTAHWQKDLSTPVTFCNIDVSYDENSNITRTVDSIFVAPASPNPHLWDVAYTIDNLHRVTKTSDGNWNGSTITDKKREQLWTLTHTGNWSSEKLDLDGDGSFAGTGEHDDSRTHNKVNELVTQDLDSTPSTTTDNATLSYDVAGNLTDDGRRYTYIYDPIGRLRKVYSRSSSNLIAEYRYNGLGFRIAYHEDTDNSGAVDSSDKWYYLTYDPSWRIVAVFRGTSANSHDSDPKEVFVNHAAGMCGFGDGSLLDGVISRYKDANTAWTAESDGRLEQRIYYGQNPRGDVVAIVGSDGAIKEWVRYSAYGIPFGLPAGDTDSDGDCDTTDTNQIQTWINGSQYDVRGDLDLDGDVDATDKSIALGNVGASLGWGVLSGLGNRKGFAGYERDANMIHKWHVRNRVFDSDLGRWLQRDRIGYADGPSLYEYARSNTNGRTDPLGLTSSPFHDEAHKKSSFLGLGKDPDLSNSCIIEITLANLAQDNFGFGTFGFSPVDHFDNNLIKKSADQMKVNARALWNCTDCDCEKFKAKLQAFGAALHALQDFYSHSNYVELHLNDTGGIQPYDFGALDKRTADPPKGLRTGGFAPILFFYGFLWGGHAAISHDSPDHENHALAVDVATRATTALWNQVKEGMKGTKCWAAFKACCPKDF